MKFLKYQNRLSVVCVETDAVSATVIGDAANVGGGVFCIYAACLSCAGSAIQVVDGQIPVLTAVLRCVHSLPQRVDVPGLEAKGGGFLDDLHGGAAVLEALQQLCHGGRAFLLFRWERSPLEKAALYRCFSFIRVRPLAGFGNVISVLPGRTQRFFNVCNR